MGGPGTEPLRDKVVWKGGAEQLRLPARRGWPVVAFLALWLSFWTWGGVQALATDNRMVVVWFGLCALGWCSAAMLLMGRIAAADTVSVHAGELIIARRAGPLVRTWRYRTSALCNLRVDLTPWSGDGADGAEHLVFLRQQWGTVRLDHGTETVHLAPHASEADAQRVLEWLRQRLPSSASV